MTDKPTIGILAGMGPRSTGPFVDMVVDACRRIYSAKHDIDFPPIMIYSLPTPFYPDIEPDHDAMQTAIIEGLQRLAGTGVAFIAMPCNTAHLYYDALAEACPAPLLNMLTTAMDALPSKADEVAVFGTRPTIEAGFYQTTLARRGKGWVVRPDWQERVDKLLIWQKEGKDPEKARLRWRALLDEAREAGADTAILACTDLNTIPLKNEPPLSLFDATRILAEATVHRWLDARNETSAP
ncbi:MAG: amino acid racemase [Acidobacteriota bacterium]|nr:amino acid racemase [Acidobacteriota bacterium]